MKLSQFKFKLPLDQVALYPHSVEHTIERSDGTKQTFCVTRRDEARLMVLHKKSGEIEMFKKDADGNPIEGEFLELEFNWVNGRKYGKGSICDFTWPEPNELTFDDYVKIEWKEDV